MSTPAIQLADSSVCRDLCRKYAAALFYASAFLPRPKRDAVYALHAFCHLIQEAVGHSPVSDPTPTAVGVTCCSTSSLDQTIGLLRAKLDLMYADQFELPLPEFRDESQHVLAGVLPVIQRYQIPQQYFIDFAEGCRQRLAIPRFATWVSLEKHCQLSGGMLGRIAGCVLGLSHSDAGNSAAAMGVAMRFTSLLRGIPKDAGHGRVLLPLEDLARFKVTQGQMISGTVTPAFQELMRFQIGRARDLYRRAAAGIVWLEGDGSRLAAASFAIAHAGFLHDLERRGGDVFSDASPTTGARAPWILAQAWRLARRKVDAPLPDVFR